MASPRAREPTDLGRLSKIDPLAIVPGVRLWERFCVIGKVRHASPLWSVPVTDIHSELGRAPHYSLVLEVLPIAEHHRERIRRAVVADEQVQPRVRATIDLPKGMALIHEPVEGEHLGAQLPEREARNLALALSGMLARLHEANVRGIAMHSSDLRQSEGQFRFTSYKHLCGAGTAEEDVEGLLALLQRVAAHHLSELFEPKPRSSAELWQRARALSRGQGPLSTPLSQYPPFVGREEARRELEKAFNDARIARSSITLVCGTQGVGKSRLLEELASWLRVEDRALEEGVVVVAVDVRRLAADEAAPVVGVELDGDLSAHGFFLLRRVSARLRRGARRPDGRAGAPARSPGERAARGRPAGA